MTAAITAICASLLVNAICYPAIEVVEYHNRLPIPERRVIEVPEPPERNTLENVLLTHYCVCEKCCGKATDHPAYGITASGRHAQPYVSIAVDPEVIPLGSTVWLEYSDGRMVECRADDTGGAIDGARIDLCVTSHTEALELGIEYITVYWEVKSDEASLQ